MYVGSAATGAGIEALMAGLADLLAPVDGDVDGPLSGVVFKVERGTAGERIADVRLFAGTMRVRERLLLGPDETVKFTGITVFAEGGAAERSSVDAGQIARVRGLAAARIGQVVGIPRSADTGHQFAPPSLETVVDPCRPADRGALYAALAQLADQDPLINLRQDDERTEISVSLYGEVQKEVIAAMLADDENPFLATVGLRVEPGPVGGGCEFRLEVELGSMPPAFFTAVEQAALETLRAGPGRVGSGRLSRHDDAFGLLGHAEPRTRDVRCQHVEHRRRLQGADTAGADGGAPRGRHHGARADPPRRTRHPRRRVGGNPEPVLPTARRTARHPAAPDVVRRGGGDPGRPGPRPPAATDAADQRGGGGVVGHAFERYQEVQGPRPGRPRTDQDPRDRTGYLLRVARRA